MKLLLALSATFGFALAHPAHAEPAQTAPAYYHVPYAGSFVVIPSLIERHGSLRTFWLATYFHESRSAAGITADRSWMLDQIDCAANTLTTLRLEVENANGKIPIPTQPRVDPIPPRSPADAIAHMVCMGTMGQITVIPAAELAGEITRWRAYE